MWQRSRLFLTVALWAAVAGGCSSRDGADPSLADVSRVVEIDRVIPVGRSEVTESLELVGTLYPWRFAAIVPEVEGVIARLPTHEKEIGAEVGGRVFSMPVVLDIGHEVKEGSILAEIDKGPFQLELDVAEAKLDVTAKQLENLLAWKRPEEIKQLEAQTEEAAALLKRANLYLDRVRELSANTVVSRSEYDAALAAYDVAIAAKKRADAALELANAGPTPEEILVAKAQVALAQADVALREDDLSKCTIHCPYDAIIVDRLAGVGDRVTSQTPIMQIIDPTYLLAQVAVPEKYQRLVEVNDLATVQVPGVSQPVPGLVALVNEKIDPETRTFRVRVGVENLRRGLESGSSAWVFKSGSYARVTLSLKSAADALVVPFEAVTFEEGKPAVFVFQGDHVEKRPVRLGIFDRSRYQIVDGLSEGEQVVVGKTALLADGMPVRLKATGPSPGETARDRSPTGGEAAGGGGASLSLATDPAGAQP